MTSPIDRVRRCSIAQSRAGRPKPEKQQKDVTILDVYGNTACVKLEMNGWINYLHVARIDGQWKIVNVLWELKPENK